MPDPAYYIYVRQHIPDMTPAQLERMQIDILEKLAIICDTLGTIEQQTWRNIPGGKHSYDFNITRHSQQNDLPEAPDEE